MDKDDMKHGRVLFEALERVDRGGEFLKAADDELQNAVRLVLERGDSATVTIKLKISKVEKGGERMMLVAPSVSATVPKISVRDRMMFASDEGELVLNDPDQGLLPLEDGPRKVVQLLPPDDVVEVGYAAPRKVKGN